MTTSESSWTIRCQDTVFAAEFSPYNWSTSLLAIGTNTRVLIVNCKFKEDNQAVDDFSHEVLREFNHGTRVHNIAWSPETSLTLAPKVLKFATSGADKVIRLFTSNLKNDDHVTMLDGHGDYVNSITFEPHHGSQIASTGDDYTCRIWNLDGTPKLCFALNSPGMSVCWHKEDVGRIMVAQKNGIIRFYNIHNQQPIRSLDCCQTPLMSAHWCPGDHFKVGAVAGSSLFIWDVAQSSLPKDKNQIHVDGALQFRWAQNNPYLFATEGRPQHQIKVIHYRQNKTLLNTSLAVGMGMTWHGKLTILAIVGDKEVHLWKIDT